MLQAVNMQKGIFCSCFLLLLAGCKSTEPLYYYGDYNAAVYSYFKGDGTTLSEQIAVLNDTIEKAAVSGRAVAPGVHAHLGMLYFESGNATLGNLHFEEEKALFPESAKYLDFLLKSKGA